MAASWLLVAVKLTNTDSETLQDKLHPGDLGTAGLGERRGKKIVGAISNVLNGLAGGATQGNVWATVTDDAGAYSTSQIVCTQANAAGNYVRWTYGSLTITLTEGTDFARGASDTACGDALEDAINNHAVLGSLYTAVNTTGTVALTAKVPTSLMHDVALSTDDATAFALTQAASGTEGAAKWFLQHLRVGKDA